LLRKSEEEEEDLFSQRKQQQIVNVGIWMTDERTVKPFYWQTFLACSPLFTNHGGCGNEMWLIEEIDQSINEINWILFFY
jgi:hypothetical protein